MSFWFILAVPVFLVTVIAAIDLLYGMIHMTRLSKVPPAPPGSQPKISLIVPACNEEENIAQAMMSLLQQDYENLQIIAINDRSTDRTGEILEQIAAANPALKVLHISTLPQGWMGKANALQEGAASADGEFLIFTDGDIIMAPETISRAAHRILAHDLDHLCLVFRNNAPGWLLNSLILDAGAGLLQLFRPWRVSKRKSREFIGIGAFNMVRKTAYEAIGGHRQIRMHPIDDIMLGKLLKKNGYRQDCLLGCDLVSVPWYSSVSAMIEGLMKNILALINYRFALVPPLVTAVILINILPLWGVLFGHGISQLLFALVVVIKLGVFATGTRLLKISISCTFGTIISPYISCYIILKATWRNMSDGGIYWRGTHYPLEKLRTNEHVLF